MTATCWWRIKKYKWKCDDRVQGRSLVLRDGTGFWLQATQLDGQRRINHKLDVMISFPWWLRQSRICLQCRIPRFNPWVGKIPWRREWVPTLVFLHEKFHGQRRLVGYRPWGHKELDMTESLSLSFWYPNMKLNPWTEILQQSKNPARVRN